jgi:hypothetical protein
MARRTLYEAALRCSPTRSRRRWMRSSSACEPAGVLLPRNEKPQQWAKVHLTDTTNQPVYSI